MTTLSPPVVNGIAIDRAGTRRHEQGVMLRTHPVHADWMQLEISVVDIASQMPVGVDADLRMEQQATTFAIRNLGEDQSNRLPVQNFQLGKVCPAITLFLDVDADGVIQGHRFQSTQFKLEKALDFNEFERLHRSRDPHIRTWVHFFDNLQSAFVTVSDSRYLGDRMARRISSLINHYAGRTLFEAGVPALYFSERDMAEAAAHFQALPPQIVTHVPEGERNRQLYVTDCSDKAAERHYARISSPVRNFFDLVNQRILAATLAGSAQPYTHAQLEKFCAAGNERIVFDKHEGLVRDWAIANPHAIAANPRIRADQIVHALYGPGYLQGAYAAAMGRNAAILMDDEILEAMFAPETHDNPLQQLLANQLIDHAAYDTARLERIMHNLKHIHPDIGDTLLTVKQDTNVFHIDFYVIDRQGGVLRRYADQNGSVVCGVFNVGIKALRELLHGDIVRDAQPTEARELLLTDTMRQQALNL